MTKDCSQCEGWNEFKKNKSKFLNMFLPKPEKKAYLVSISTPYLMESEKMFENYYKVFPGELPKGLNPSQATTIQKAAYGFNPNNLNGKKTIITKKGNLVLINSEIYPLLKCQVFSDLEITGSNDVMEEVIREHMGSGLITARYSIFYGGKSMYTGRSPEDSGYSLDIPKNPNIVKTMLRDDSFLESILSRDGSKILSSIGKLNKKLEKPILVTSYLEEVLEVKR